MAATAAVCDSYKQDILNGIHQPTDSYKIALYVAASASLDKTTTAYSVTGEVTGTGYTAGGQVLVGFSVSISGDTAYLTFTTNPSWANSTITADSALTYNSTRSNKAVCVLTFTSASSSNGTFTVQFPAAGVSALLTIT